MFSVVVNSLYLSHIQGGARSPGAAGGLGSSCCWNERSSGRARGTCVLGRWFFLTCLHARATVPETGADPVRYVR